MPGVEYTRTQRRQRISPPRACAPGSFRTVRSGGAQVVVCCPKGQWSRKAGRCKVGMRAQSVRTPR